MRKAIVKSRLRAAQEAGDLRSLNLVAKRARVAHTTLTRLWTGEVSEVNASTLRCLSRVLRVPAEWLTGERDDLPYVPEFEYPQTASKAKSPPAARRSLWQRPTADYVRWSWLMQGIEAAVRRDLEMWCGGDANSAYESWGRSLLTVFTEMAQSLVWRLALQRPARDEGWNQLWQAADVPTIEWLEHAIEPWLEGRAYLNADVISKLFTVLLAAPERFWESGTRDTGAQRALEKYAKLCTKAVKRELAEIGPPEGEWSVPRRRKRTKSGVSSRKGHLRSRRRARSGVSSRRGDDTESVTDRPA